MPNNIRIGTQVAGVAKAESDLDKLRNKADQLQKMGAKGFMTGVGAAATLKAFSLIDTAASAFINTMGDAIAGAMEQEESMERLAASLRANVPGWDGNTDAIERNIDARMKLGFTDEELRDSLSLLVAATNDVSKAEQIQTAAMDLARFKKISLAQATEALTKVEAGSFRILKSLGIELKEGATQTEAMAAVMKVAAGQADAFANTNSGKLLASQIRVNEALEDFGDKVMPGAIDMMAGMADAAVGAATMLDVLTDGLSNTTEGQAAQREGALDVMNALAALIPAYGLWDDAMRDVTIRGEQTADKSTESAERLKGSWTGGLEDMEDSARDWRDTWRDVTGESIRRTERLRDKMADAAEAISDDFFDPIETRAEIFDAHQATLAAIEAKRIAKNKADHRDAARDIVSSLDDQAEGLQDLSRQGKITKKDVDKFEADVKASYKALGQRVPAELQHIIDKYRALARLKPVSIQMSVQAHPPKSGEDTHGPGRGQLQFAEGGRVPGPKGAPVDATLHGGEFVVSNEMQRDMGSMGSGSRGSNSGVTLIVNPPASWTPGMAREWADGIGPAVYDYLYRRGALSRA